MKLSKGSSVFLIYILGISLLLSNGFASADGDKLSESQYVDPKGYFKLVPPVDWLAQEFKNDPRGKVKFVRSSSPETMVLIIAQASPFQDLKELLEDSERTIARLNQKLGTSAYIERTTFGNIQAMRLTLETPPKFKQMHIQFLLGGNHYTIVYGASPNNYSESLPIAMASIETFEPTLKKTNKEESIKHVVASKVRTARNLIKLRQMDYALIIINEGLQLEPENERLLQMKRSLVDK